MRHRCNANASSGSAYQRGLGEKVKPKTDDGISTVNKSLRERAEQREELEVWKPLFADDRLSIVDYLSAKLQVMVSPNPTHELMQLIGVSRATCSWYFGGQAELK